MTRLSLSLALMLTVPGLPLFAQSTQYPFEGNWDCEVATFSFTADAYNNGSEDLPIQKITDDGGNFILDFSDGYQIGLSSVTATSMTWLSMASGDMFDCTRIE